MNRPNRENVLMRHGMYCGIAARVLGDDSYALRVLGHVQDFSDADLMRDWPEIQARLAAAGYCRCDEDPYDAWLRECEEDFRTKTKCTKTK